MRLEREWRVARPALPFTFTLSNPVFRKDFAALPQCLLPESRHRSRGLLILWSQVQSLLGPQLKAA